MGTEGPREPEVGGSGGSAGIAHAARRLGSRAQEPVDPGSLIAFRVAFGLLATAGALRFLAKGWVQELYLTPTYFFSYGGMDWIQPWPGPWMVVHVAALAALGMLIAAGVAFPLTMGLYALGFTYLELIDKANYLNHYYFISLAALLCVFIPLGRLGPRHKDRPGARWMIWALRAQVGMVYLFAGLAKVKADWLLDAQPLTIWLTARGDRPLIGPLLTLPLTPYLMSWGGLLFDLSAPFILAWRRTRALAYVGVLVFHGLTGWLFNIGVFPWVMIALTPIFFEPDWPRRLEGAVKKVWASPWRPPSPSTTPSPPGSARDLTGRPPAQEGVAKGLGLSLGDPLSPGPGAPDLSLKGRGCVSPEGDKDAVTLRNGWRSQPPTSPLEGEVPAQRGVRGAWAHLRSPSPPQDTRLRTQDSPRLSPWLAAGLGAFFLLQSGVALRHHAYPGSMLWTEAGFRFAWHVMVMEKTGHLDYVVTCGCGHRIYVNPGDLLTPTQHVMARTQPDMILQLAHHLRDQRRAEGHTGVEVRARSRASLNGRPSQVFIDPEVDLAALELGAPAAAYVLPLAGGAGGDRAPARGGPGKKD